MPQQRGHHGTTRVGAAIVIASAGIENDHPTGRQDHNRCISLTNMRVVDVQKTVATAINHPRSDGAAKGDRRHQGDPSHAAASDRRRWGCCLGRERQTHPAWAAAILAACLWAAGYPWGELPA